MIFVTNDKGETTYVSPEWGTLTGEDNSAALNLAWLQQVHADDRDVVAKTMREATKAKVAFTLGYRLRFAARWAWVVASGLPSFGGVNGAFIGYTGSVTEVADQLSLDLRAFGNVGAFQPLPPHRSTEPHSGADALIDHLLLARALATQHNNPSLRHAIDMSLYLAARTLRSH